VELQSKLRVRGTQAAIVSVVSQLLSVFCSSWNFNWSPEALVGVTLLVNKLLDFLLSHASGVHHNVIVDGKSCGSLWIVIRNHEEVESDVTVSLNNCRVNYSTFAWIDNFSVNFLKDSGLNSLVQKHVKDLGTVVLVETLDCVLKSTVWSFVLNDVLLECWASNSIPKHDDLLRLPAVVVINVVLKSLSQEV
jgi:hypothetical protein